MADRRQFIKNSAILGLAGIGASLFGAEKLSSVNSLVKKYLPPAKFTLPSLPYAYNALEPFIDRQTMEIHHSKHHQAYVDKLNAELEKTDLKGLPSAYTLEDIFESVSKLPAGIRNNGGGHYNHSLFWEMLRPNPDSKPNIPDAKVSAAINKQFKSFEEFKREFSEKALKLFGSGWCWLIEHNGNLKITTTPNQDNPLMKLDGIENGKIILGLDVWEHAYYLKYQNKRADYISGWWHIINWKKAEELYSGK